MTTPYTTGSVTLTNGSAVVTGVGTAWQTALIAGGTLYAEADGNPLPILSVDSNTQITAAIKWKGANGTYPYAIMRDTAYGQQTVANAQALSTYLQRLDNASLAALASIAATLGAGKVPRGLDASTMEWLTVTDTAKALLNLAGPALADRLPYLNGVGSAALTTLTSFARQICGAADAAGLRTLAALNTTDNVAFRRLTLSDAGYGMVLLGLNDANSFHITKETSLSSLNFWQGAVGAGSLRLQLDAVGTHVGTAFNDPGTTGNVGIVLRNDGRMSVGGPTNFPAGAFARLGTDGNLFDFYKNTGIVGSISLTGVSTSYNTTSDYRLKTDVAPLVTFALTPEQFDLLDDALLRVMSLQPVSYLFRDHQQLGLQHGFLAHELQQVMPHAVTGGKDAIEDVGVAVIAARVIPSHVEPGDLVTVVDPESGDLIERRITDRIVPEQVIEEQRFENIVEAEAPEGSTWTKTGTREVYQTVDHSKIVADLTAALQSATVMLLEQEAAIAALNVRAAALENALSA